MSLIEFDNINEYSACIKVIGIGGGGTNAVNSMIHSNIIGVEFLVANTDVQSLELSPCPQKLQIGTSLTKGLGAGSNPEIGRKAAEENEENLHEILSGADMVFITAGMAFAVDWASGPAAVPAPHEAPSITLSDLDPSTEYRYKITLINAEGDTFTTDPRGNEQWSRDLTLITSAEGDTLPAVAALQQRA